MAEHPWYAVLQYCGRDFAGWQSQPAARTVQGDLEQTLSRLEGQRVMTHAAGRTDAGVHALGQVISFSTRRAWEGPDLRRALNALLPDDIWIERVSAAPAGFHARKSAMARVYRYVVGCDDGSRSPFRHPFEWALGRPLDPSALAHVAGLLTGEHDFRALSTVGQTKPHYRCRVVQANWQARADGEGFIFTIEADRFLHRMVRFLVGLSIDVALGRRGHDDVTRLLTAHTNADASPPAPPEGLYLVAVRYPQLEEDHAQ
ncbi:MAG TPA: tRNA pseudouridine(38-40) synthase TruA [Gemmatimonadales bacterium]